MGAGSPLTGRRQYRAERERQNERLEQFASKVSHDFRNPLNVAPLRSEWAAANTDTETDTDNEDLDHAPQALARMETLIQDGPTFARRGQPIVDPEPVRLSTVASDAWSMVESRDASLEPD